MNSAAFCHSFFATPLLFAYCPLEIAASDIHAILVAPHRANDPPQITEKMEPFVLIPAKLVASALKNPGQARRF